MQSNPGTPHQQAVEKPVFLVILNEVKDLNCWKIRDSSLRPE
jgi:hypothetical protein